MESAESVPRAWLRTNEKTPSSAMTAAADRISNRNTGALCASVADAKIGRKPQGGSSKRADAGSPRHGGEALQAGVPQRAITSRLNDPGRMGGRGFGRPAVAGGRGPNSAV